MPQKFAARYPMGILFGALAYGLIARVSLILGGTSPVSLLWPVSGLAIAGLLLYGKRYAPAIWLGAFAAYFAAGVPLGAALAAGAGNMLQALLAVSLLALMRFNNKFERVYDVIIFFIVCVYLAPLVGPTIGIAAFGLGLALPPEALGLAWRIWYAGNLLGILAVVPLLLLRRTTVRLHGIRLFEFLAFIAATTLMGAAVFLNIFQVPTPLYPLLLYPLFFPLLWAVMRFDGFGVSLALAILAAAAAWGTRTGSAPFIIQASGVFPVALFQLSLYMSTAGFAAHLVTAALLEQARAERLSRSTLESLEAAGKAKDRFLAMLAHELRNPLAPLLSALQLFRLKGSGDPDMRRMRDMMEREVVQMSKLLDDLLDVSRIDRGIFELRKEKIDMRDVLRHAVETSTPLIGERGHALSVQIPEVPLPLLGDPLRLEQVVVNLLNNAAKYTQNGGTIAISAENRGRAVVVKVKDNGIGLSREALPKIFEAFWKQEGSRTRAEGGLGLGLALVKSIVEGHGGDVHAFSEGEGKGAEFVVHLPAAHVEADAPAEDEVTEHVIR